MGAGEIGASAQKTTRTGKQAFRQSTLGGIPMHRLPG
jgi:hypothetical protein